MIFKVQKPLASNTTQGMQEYLVYNERRSIIIHTPPSKELDALFGDKVKIHVEGRIISDVFVFDTTVPDPGW